MYVKKMQFACKTIPQVFTHTKILCITTVDLHVPQVFVDIKINLLLATINHMIRLACILQIYNIANSNGNYSPTQVST